MMAHDLTWARDCAMFAFALVLGLGAAIGVGVLRGGRRRVVYLFTDDPEDAMSTESLKETPASLKETFTLEPAPSSYLNTRFGTVYAPRVPTPGRAMPAPQELAPYVGYRCLEVAPDLYTIDGFDADGRATELFRGVLAETFHRFAFLLGMIEDR